MPPADAAPDTRPRAVAARPPGTVAAVRSIAGNDLRRRWRDHTALLTGVVAPLVLAVLIGAALSNMGNFYARVGIVDADGSPLSRGIVDSLTHSLPPDGVVRLESIPDEATARQRVGGGAIGAVIVVPAGFGASLTGPAAFAGSPPAALVVLSDARSPFVGDIARAVANGVAARIDAARLGTATALATGPAPGTAEAARVDQLVAAASDLSPALATAVAPAGAAYRPIAYFAASVSVVFLFFTMGAGARSLRAEHAEGTLARLRAAPVADRSILLGKALSTMVVGMASLLTVWAATTVIFHADWGDPVAVLAVMVAAVLAVGGIGSLITGLASTLAQAEAFTSIVTFVLALLGGSFQPPGSLPESFERLSLLTPNGLAQRAFVQIGAAGAGLADVLPYLAGLLIMAAVTLTIGVTLIRRRVMA